MVWTGQVFNAEWTLSLRGSYIASSNMRVTSMVYSLVSVMVQSSLIVGTDLHLRLCPPHTVGEHHVVVDPLPPADPVQHGLVHPVVHNQVPQSTTRHLTPTTTTTLVT